MKKIRDSSSYLESSTCSLLSLFVWQSVWLSPLVIFHFSGIFLLQNGQPKISVSYRIFVFWAWTQKSYSRCSPLILFSRNPFVYMPSRGYVSLLTNQNACFITFLAFSYLFLHSIASFLQCATGKLHFSEPIRLHNFFHVYY